MADIFGSKTGTVKMFGGSCARPNSSTISGGYTHSTPQNKTLQENLKDLKKEIVSLEKNIKAPFNKKAFQIHANKSYAKGIIHRFPTNPAQNNSEINNTAHKTTPNRREECSTPTNKARKTQRYSSSEVDAAIYTLIDAKDTFVREKQKEIYDANEEFRKLMIEAEKIKKEENAKKMRRIDQEKRKYEKELEEAVKQLEMQLRDRIQAEEVTARANIQAQIKQLEKNSLFCKSDGSHYPKLTPSKIDRLYAVYSNTPLKQDREQDNYQARQQIQNSSGQFKRNQVVFESSQSASNLKTNSLTNKAYKSPNKDLFTTDNDNRYATNNLFEQSQSRSCRNVNNQDYIDEIFFHKSPSVALSKIEQLKSDIHLLQKRNQIQFPQSSDSKNNTIKRDKHYQNYSPISKEYLMKSNKKKCKLDVDLSSSSEDEKKFVKDYKKYKENYELKEKVRQKQNQEFWENTSKQ